MHLTRFKQGVSRKPAPILEVFNHLTYLTYFEKLFVRA